MEKFKITPLGTVSPYPKGATKCPSFLIKYGKEKILLDCGNGCTSLLNFPYDLENLSVFITHYHKDHFGDIGAIQYASFVYHNLGMLEEVIDVYLPKNEYASNRASIVENKESYTKYHDISDGDVVHIGNLEITISDNKSHSIESFMIKVSDDTRTIVYTSDIGTSNFDELISFCKKADMLICESSFLERHSANSKTHMTARKAGELAESANVGHLVLTHFWPEEDKGNYLVEAKTVFENVRVAIEGETIIL